MAYIKPLVQVYQEYESTSATSQWATLNACVIGPCYHKVDIDSDVEADILPAFVGKIDAGALATVEIPAMLPGAIVQEESIKILLRNVFVDMNGSSLAVASVSQATVSFLEVDFPEGIAPGDYFTIRDADDSNAVVSDKFRVISADPVAFTVTLEKLIKTESTNLTVDWLKSVPTSILDYDHTAVSADAVAETVALTALQVAVGGVDKTVYEADVYVGHKALRQDLLSLGNAASVTEVETKIGSPESYNPLALATVITLANTTNSVSFIGVQSDDVAGYTAAKDILETTDEVYSLVPLSQESSILNIFGAHAAQMSLPEKGAWRLCIGNTPLPIDVTVASGAATIAADLSSDPRVLECPSGDFLSNEVVSGDTVYLYTDTLTFTEFEVDSVVSEDALILTEDTTDFTLGSTYNMKVVRSSDKELQSLAVGETSASFNNSRFIHVWPDIAIVDGEELPGYYLCCAVAGMVSGLPSHRGMTRLSVAGIAGLKNSGDYFNASQLDNIAEGGTFIFTQANSSAPPFVRHQMTTDTSTVEFQELSFVKNYDFVSFIMKDALDNFIGQYNVTPATLATLDTVVRATLESLKLYSVAKIGSPVLGYDSNILVTQSETQADRVEIWVRVEFPYPLNMIGLHLVSSSL